MEGGPDRKIKLDHSPGLDEVLPIFYSLQIFSNDVTTLKIFNLSCAIVQLYIEGYLQAMLDAMYKQEYLRVRVIDDQVISSYQFAFCDHLLVFT
jgi:hypothetical protein